MVSRRIQSRRASKPKITAHCLDSYQRILGDQRFVLLNIGARHGVGTPWKDVEDFLDVILFEPDQEEAHRLMRKSNEHQMVCPCAVWNSSGYRDFYVTRNRSLCSLLKPDEKIVEGSAFHAWGFYQIDKVEKVKVETLASISDNYNLPRIDFISVDVQGGEMHVLQSLDDKQWECVLGAKSEAYLAALYENAPTVADILPFFYSLNFTLHNFEDLFHFPIVDSVGQRIDGPSLLGTRAYSGYPGRMMICDLLFMRTRHWTIKRNDPDAIRRAVFLHCLHGYYDCALDLIIRATTESIITRSESDELKGCVVTLYKHSLPMKRKLSEGWAKCKRKVRVRTRMRRLLGSSGISTSQ